ncbi:SDR family oxidoreductase [Ktedonosporobacter rubrisoli]|uniref:SDR family oxidoreductase n=1 Tax=Ktedonosporobacter rubrisoli TaxID=2509675 RepID=A0A4P6K136_KTERU|nr:SDR family oxidoreductase [Ktedonosporobacter rubrisoli]QBD81136.1 SDR family oxidoreductase [Ktedonosporobacter rubrisoli]
MLEESLIALITGANKGIGFAIASALGAKGITVLIGARDQERGEAAARHLRAQGIEAHALLLDVTGQASIDAAAAWIEQAYGKLDILVNNAGANVELSASAEGRPTLPGQLTLEDLRQTFEINVFGAFAVTRAMLPLLRQAPAARIVNVSSGRASMSQRSDPNAEVAQTPPFLAYDASKAALNSMTVSLARELQDTPIKINAVGPGYVATDGNYHRGYLTPEQGARAPVAFATLPADGPSGGFFSHEGVIPW